MMRAVVAYVEPRNLVSNNSERNHDTLFMWPERHTAVSFQL